MFTVLAKAPANVCWRVHIYSKTLPWFAYPMVNTQQGALASYPSYGNPGPNSESVGLAT